MKPGFYCKDDILELDYIRIWTLFESGHYGVAKNVVKTAITSYFTKYLFNSCFTENKSILFLKFILTITEVINNRVVCPVYGQI